MNKKTNWIKEYFCDYCEKVKYGFQVKYISVFMDCHTHFRRAYLCKKSCLKLFFRKQMYNDYNTLECPKCKNIMFEWEWFGPQGMGLGWGKMHYKCPSCKKSIFYDCDTGATEFKWKNNGKKYFLMSRDGIIIFKKDKRRKRPVIIDENGRHERMIRYNQIYMWASDNKSKKEQLINYKNIFNAYIHDSLPDTEDDALNQIKKRKLG